MEVPLTFSNDGDGDARSMMEKDGANSREHSGYPVQDVEELEQLTRVRAAPESS